MEVKFADYEHLDGIMEIEAETFGALGKEAMASREMMLSRIERCNKRGAGWLLVAVQDGVVMAYLALQPTSLGAEECISWDISTDNGTFEKTYDETGDTVFGASLGARKNAPPGATILIFHQTLVLMLKRNRKRVIFCSRMPSLSRAMEERGVDPETYCFQVDANGRPLDWLLGEFYETLGVLPRKFLPNGYPPDADSAGHGAQIVLEDLHHALETSVCRTYQCGISYGKSLRKKGGS